MKIPRILLVLMVLAAASLSCNLPTREPALPPTTQPMTQNEQQQLEDQLQATLQSATQGQPITITLTQDQLSALVATEVAKQPDPILTNPSIVLRDGQMEVYGQLSQSGLSANAKIVMQPGSDANGKPKMEVVSVSVGSLPVPDVFREQITALVDSTINEYLASETNQYQVNSISITEGQMTISGVRQQP